MIAARYRNSPPLASFATAALLLLIAGCHSKTAATPENFITGLNAYFAGHSECLFPGGLSFPFETSDPAKTAQLNALVESQMLNVAVDHSIHVSRYTTTDAGARAAPRFCYGNRVISSIDSFTPPATANGFTETQVTYHYTLQDIPVWANSAGMRAAFPAMARDASGTATDKATLAGTMAGWQVPD
jgi:hypothetical protein